MTETQHWITDELFYGLSMFGVGFVLGTVRQLFILQHTELTLALAMEVPVIVLANGFVAR